jgi:hypothetical protein
MHKIICRFISALFIILFSHMAYAQAQETAVAPPEAVTSDTTSADTGTSQTWSKYLDETQYDVTASKPMLYALALFKKEGITSGYAVDIGAGTGKDTLYLLNHHWRVLAQDGSPKAINIILTRAKQMHLPTPDTQVSDFTAMQLPNDVDLINANLALPFAAPKDFPAVWQNVVQHIRVGGRFSGNFFGSKDGFATDNQMTFLTKQQLLDLFKSFKIESLTTRQGNYTEANGTVKYWQIWDIVARKVSDN